ncbi:MAG TPA: tetratricopeptide repeat protein [Pyrinomonadaceae bacterium]|jgi:predicted ATPase|nr:tetratricopeptide repeat protein [Pyrinomonadaceae bacterium]
MQQITAKLYRPGDSSYTGTAWLCSRSHALTAAHCVGDRAKKILYPGTFVLKFMNGERVEAVVEEGNYDFDLDAALLRIKGELSAQVQINCGRLPAYDPWPPRSEVWSAYGFPVGNPSGMDISGFITSPSGNVSGHPAYQLYCDQGGYGALKGTSGAAIRYEKMVVGLIRWAPKAFKQGVIYASPLNLIAAKLPMMENILIANAKAALAEFAPNLLLPKTVNDILVRRAVDKELIGRNTPQAAGAGRHNLLKQQTAFIDRVELDRVVNLLRGNVMLLTLVGESGVGKTRLSRAASKILVDYNAFRDGVFFVSMSALKDHKKVAREIANTLGIKEAQEFSFEKSLKLYLGDKQMLLVIDGFEHLMRAGSLFAELLGACPGVKILVTSREPLGLTDEEVLNVGPLLLPSADAGLDLHKLRRSPAVALFEARAGEVDEDFKLTTENCELVAGICRALSGHPMAIELVAAQATTQEDLAEVYEKVNSASTAQLEDTLQVAIEWAYGHLDPKDRSILKRLSVFVGNFTKQAAEDVCRDLGNSPEAVGGRLEELSRKCLLQEELSPNLKPRYRMLQNIHEYCLKRSDARGELASAQRSHASFYLALAKKAEARITLLTSEERKEWLDLLENELDDIRAALKWALDTKEGRDLGLQLAASLFWFWNLRGYLTEGREHVAAVLRRAGAGASAKDRAKALYAVGGLSFLRGDYAEARGWLEESVGLWREVGNKRRLAYALVVLGMVALEQGHPEEGRRYEEESVSIFKEVDDTWGLALALNDLGNMLNEPGNMDLAQAYYRQSLALWRELEDKWGYSLTLCNMGHLALRQDDHLTARELQLEALAIRRAEGDQWGFAESLRRLGSVFAAQGDYIEAAKLHYDSLVLHQQVGRTQLISECLEALAEVAVKLKQPLRAAELYGAGEAIRSKTMAGLTRIVYNTCVEEARSAAKADAALDEFDRAWARGKRLNIDQAVARTAEYVKEWTQS